MTDEAVVMARLTEALNRIVFMRPAGDIDAITRKDVIALVRAHEMVAMQALQSEQST